MNCLSKAGLIDCFFLHGSQGKIVIFSVDFYLIKFVEDGIRRVLSRDKVRIEDEAVEAGATCQAYWEDSQIKGWFSAIILAFGGKYRLKLPKVKNIEMDFS